MVIEIVGDVRFDPRLERVHVIGNELLSISLRNMIPYNNRATIRVMRRPPPDCRNSDHIAVGFQLAAFELLDDLHRQFMAALGY